MHDPNGDSPESLAKQLQEYYQAVEQEFRVNTHEFDEAKKEEFAGKAKAKLVELVPQAIATLETLLVHGEKESIRFSTAKYILDSTLSDKGFAPPEDPMAKLLKEMDEAAKQK